MHISADDPKVWVVQCRPKGQKDARWRTVTRFGSNGEIELFNDQQEAIDYAVDLAMDDNKFGYRAVSYKLKRILGPIVENYKP